MFLSQFDQTIDKIVSFYIRFDSLVDHTPKTISEIVGRFSEKFYREIFVQIGEKEYWKEFEGTLKIVIEDQSAIFTEIAIRILQRIQIHSKRGGTDQISGEIRTKILQFYLFSIPWKRYISKIINLS